MTIGVIGVWQYFHANSLQLIEITAICIVSSITSDIRSEMFGVDTILEGRLISIFNKVLNRLVTMPTKF